MISRQGLKRYLRRTLIIHTRDGKSIRGVLRDEFADCIVLAQPQFLEGTQPIGLGGDVLILRENVSWAQDVTTQGGTQDAR